MRPLPKAAALAGLAAVLVVTAIPGSPGSGIRDAASGYLSSLGRGNPAEAGSMLTDSLAALVPEAALGRMEPWVGDAGAGSIGRLGPRGWPLEIPSGEGGVRMLWFRNEDGEWLVSGDTGIDALMGSASVVCMEYALSTVVPAAAAGVELSGMRCPFSGAGYTVVDGRLVCPTGHLGEGIVLSGDGCSVRRAEVASMVGEWVADGNPFPSDLGEIWEASGGEIGLPGGYRCPVDGYSFYSLVDGGVWCPYHAELTPVEVF